LTAWMERWSAASAKERAQEQEKWKEPAALVSHLAHVGDPRLGPSREHLGRALLDLKRLHRELDKPLGAGAAVIVWLLPLVLGTDDERRQFSAALSAALRKESELFYLIDALLALRNAAAHVMAVPTEFQRADETLSHVIGATLSPWLARDSTPH
jgi:hypothetical protein